MALPDIEITKVATDGGPFVLKNLVPTLWMVAIAVAGGAVSFYQRMKSGHFRTLSIPRLVLRFVGELGVAAFIGLVTYWICKAYGVNEYLTAAGVAISGHMGARLIYLVEQVIEKRAKGE